MSVHEADPASSGSPLSTGGAENSRPRASGLTPRALVVGLFAVALVSFATLWAEQVIKRGMIGVLTFPPAAFGIFVFLIAGNRLVRRARARWALGPAELLVIYTMMLLSAWTASRGAPVRLIPLLSSLNYYADPSNKWQTTFYSYVPQQLVPWNTAGDPRQPLIIGLYEGLHYGEPIPWGAWIPPLAHWTVIIFLMYAAFICLATLLRAQWSDHERLSFPLAQLPTEFLRAEGGEAPLYRQRLLYLGAAIPVFIHLWNLGHNISPNVPQITLSWDLAVALFRTPPLNEIQSLRLVISLSAIGFFFLLPSELLFSFWFFYLVFAVGHQVVLLLLGQSLERPGHADTSLYMASAEAGGFFVLAGYLIYLTRPAIIAGARGIMGKRVDRSAAGADEMLSYRAALAGIIITTLASALWFTTMGLSFWMALMEVVLYVFVIGVVLARGTAEGGMLMTEIIFTPLDIYGMFGRRQLLGAQNLTSSVFATVPFAGDWRGLTLQGMMDTQRIADSIGMRRRSLHAVLWIGLVSSLVCTFAMLLWLNYRHGAMALNDQFRWLSGVFFQESSAFLDGSERFNPATPISFALGAGFTVLLAFLRRTLWWWPLHPLGFVMCGSWSLIVYWFPILVAWTVKTVIVHYGGLSGFTRARPFFLGLILGEMTIAIVLTLLDAVWHIPAPTIPFT